MTDTAVFERVSAEAGGIRIPACPRCGTPNVIPRKIEQRDRLFPWRGRRVTVGFEGREVTV